MAIPAVAGDLWEVRLNGRLEGQQTTNVYHFRSIGPDDDVGTNLVAVIVQCFIDNLLPILSHNWSFENATYQKVGPTLGIQVVNAIVGSNVGEISGDSLPSYCAVVFSKTGEVGGKSHRGRMYLAGIPESASTGSSIPTDGIFWAAAIAYVACIALHFINPAIGSISNHFEFVVYSRKLGGSHMPYTDAGVTKVLKFEPSQLLATMRSRKVGRGS